MFWVIEGKGVFLLIISSRDVDILARCAHLGIHRSWLSQRNLEPQEQLSALQLSQAIKTLSV
jgi:hypothetical protein